MTILSAWAGPDIATLNGQAVMLLMLVPLVLRVGGLLSEAQRVSMRVRAGQHQQSDM